MTTCPLCLNARAQRIENISVEHIIHRYMLIHKIDVRPEFGSSVSIQQFHCGACDLRFFDPMHPGSADLYDRLQALDWYYQSDKAEYQQAVRHVHLDSAVLEIGCGMGAFAEKIAPREYVGLELSPRAVQMAVSKGLTVVNESVQEHALRFPGHYDVVCGFQVLEHVDRLQTFIQASLACLKRSGTLIFSVPSADSFVSCDRVNVLNLPPHHMSWWTDQCLRNTADLFGLQVVEIIHEPLARIHRRWYTETILIDAVRRIGRRKYQLLDQSLEFRLVARGAHLLSGVIAPLIARHELNQVNGHSVTVVYATP